MTYGNDSVSGVPPSLTGLTKRELFAAMALQGLCVNGAFSEQIQTQSEEAGTTSSVAIATYAVDIADELIKALNK